MVHKSMIEYTRTDAVGVTSDSGMGKATVETVVKVPFITKPEDLDVVSSDGKIYFCNQCTHVVKKVGNGFLCVNCGFQKEASIKD